MSDLTPITREEKLLNGEDLEPITREEKFIKRIYDKTQAVPEPVTRREMFLKKAGEGGGGDVTIEQLNVSENGAYSEQGKAYSPVVVNVPSAVLGSLSVTENGTYTPPSGVDGYNEVTVNVPLPENALLLKDIPSTPTAIATFSDGAEMVMPSLTVGVNAWQEGSGDPSPSNVRPIHGWDSVNVSVSGINIWNEEWEVGDINSNGVPVSASDRIRSKNFIPVKPNTTYYLKCPTVNARIITYDNNKNFVEYYSSGINNTTFTVGSNVYYIKFYMFPAYGTTYNNDISINYPSTDTEYHAYNGATYTIDLDGTRYGGTLDVVSGVLTVDRGILTLNGSEDYYTIQSSSVDGNTVLRVATGQACKQNENQKSNYGTFNNNAWQPLESRANTFVLGSEENLYLQLSSNTASTVEEFKALFASNPLQVVYELATPLTIQLSPTAVKSLEGVNNVFADSGEILEGEYLGGVS